MPTVSVARSVRPAHELLVAALGLASCLARPALAGLPPQVYVLARGQSALWEVGTETGDRRLLELAAYPAVMSVSHAVVTRGGELVFTATNAALQRAVFAYNPSTGSRVAVSGPLDGYGEVVRGAGPPLDPLVSGLALAPWGGLYALRGFLGPVLVSLATGDRTVVSQSVKPAVGEGFPLTRPVDLTVETAGSLLVMEEYEGLVRVSLDHGTRTMVYPSTQFIEPPYRFDRLPDGRVVHLAPGTDALFVFDPHTRVDAPLSGRGRGSGPPVGALSDLAVAPDGTVVVVDVMDPAVLAVDPTTGDRTLLTGPKRGAGPALPTALDRPTLASFAPESASPGVAPRLVRRRLPKPDS